MHLSRSGSTRGCHVGLDGGRVVLDALEVAVRVEELVVVGVVPEDVGEVAALAGAMAWIPIPKGPWFRM